MASKYNHGKNIIALIDCDSFFVSCEQAMDTSLAGKAVCVLSNNDACVIARSFEAKKIGIKMGMPYYMAKKQFPDAIYLSGEYHNYKDFSRKVMAILREFSPSVEVYSIDEAFVEFTGLRRLYKQNYFALAKTIRQRIKEEVGITVSIGVSKSKVLAKLACENAKPNKGDGVYLIGQRKIQKLLKQTPVEDIWGIGRNTAKAFNRWGILNCAELVLKSDEWLKNNFGKRGVEIKHELLGEYVDKVKTRRRLPKSIQNTRSFPVATDNFDYIKSALNIHIHNSCTKLRHFNGKCKTIAVMLKTKDFFVRYEKKTLDNLTSFELEISKEARKLLESMHSQGVLYRSCGITLEDIDYTNDNQLTFFEEENSKDYDKLTAALDKLEAKFGRNIVKTGFSEELF